jgi:hypothetical protein
MGENKMIKLTDLLKENGEKYPPYMFSPIGFGCHVCEYYYKDKDKHMCSNKEYQKYMGTNELIDPKTKEQIKDPSKWCSNWFEPK